MGSKTMLLCGIIIGALISVAVIEYLSLNIQVLHNVGIIRSNIGVYWDNTCINQTTQIDWGTLSPASEKTKILYLENNKNTTMTITLET